MPLQSIKSIRGFSNLLPDLEATLMSFTRPTECSIWELAFYWLNTPSSIFLTDWRQLLTLEVFTLISMSAEANILPWPFARLESITTGTPTAKERLTLLRFGLPIARSNSSPLALGLPRPDMFRLQVFATSWRLTPRTALWLCFMPLALAGFSLQSVPLESSIAPSSGTIPPRKMYLFSTHNCRRVCDRIVRLNKPEGLCDLTNTLTCKVLIRSQVRSHPTLVLPSVGGRYSPGIFNTF